MEELIQMEAGGPISSGGLWQCEFEKREKKEKTSFSRISPTSAASRITLRGTRGTLHLPAEEPVTDTMLEDSRELPAFLEVMRAKLNRRVPGITEALFPILKGGTVLCEIHRTI